MPQQLPQPPIPTGVDLHDFSFTPIFRAQLFRSAFHARATDAEWRAGVTLWLKSWDQIPAGSLPDDDVELCRLAEFGRDQRGWKKVKRMAMYGWYICDDLRFYHKVVAQGVLAAFMRRKAASEKGKLGASRRWPVIEGGKGNGSAIAQALPKPMPGDSNLTLDIRDINPTQTLPENREGPVLENGTSNPRTLGTNPRAKGTNPRALGTNPRGERRIELDEAHAAWVALLASKGAKRDARVQAAIDALGGWPRIQQREHGIDSAMVRKAFCEAYRKAGDS